MPSLCVPNAPKEVSILWSKKEELAQWLFAEASEVEIQEFYRRAVCEHRLVIEKMLTSPLQAKIDGEAKALAQDIMDQEREEGEKVVVQEMLMEERLLECDVEDPFNIDRKLEVILERERADYDLAMKEKPILQFSAPMYFCSLDNEDFIVLDVIRIGDLSKRSVVHFTTKDASAKAGEKFVKTSGSVVFKEGSTSEEIKIPLVKSNTFDTTTEFKVALLNEPAAENALLGRYLHQARVKVIDGNCFPTNKYSTLIRTGEFSKVPFWGLFVEYLKLNWQNQIVKKGTIKWFLVDTLGSLYLLLQLLLNVYLVDKILDASGPDDPLMHLFICAICLISPFAVLHFLEFRKVTWKVGGASRALLQNSLLRKFMNYSEECRAQLDGAEIMMAMTRDVTHVVHEGYIKVLDLIGSATDLMAALTFNILAPVLFDKDPRPLGFYVLAAFPVILLSFLFVRREITTKYISARNEAQDELVATVDRTIINYRLVADFGQRPFFETRFAKRVADYNNTRTEANKVLANNRQFSPWVTTLFVAAYMVFGGMQVVDGHSNPGPDALTLGMFLANLRIIKQIGTSWGHIYKVLMDIEAIYPALMQIVDLINMATDVPSRKAQNRQKREATAALRDKMRDAISRGWPADNLPIVLEELTFNYGEAKEKPAFEMKGVLRFHQGEFTSLIGPPGEGKSTLLRMMGGVILPKPGSLFVPSHLRVLHVASDPLFVKASLFDNLIFGCLPSDSDASMERVVRICERLGIREESMAYVRQGPKGKAENWAEQISLTQKCLLAHARALITNPELMCIHKPLMVYNDTQSEYLLSLLREFCVSKGVEQDAATRHLRRPRTCLITASKMSSVRHADHVYHVSHKAGVRYVPKEMCQHVFERSESLRVHEISLHKNIDALLPGGRAGATGSQSV